jgi:hypothetical protein
MAEMKEKHIRKNGDTATTTGSAAATATEVRAAAATDGTATTTAGGTRSPTATAERGGETAVRPPVTTLTGLAAREAGTGEASEGKAKRKKGRLRHGGERVQ